MNEANTPALFRYPNITQPGSNFYTQRCIQEAALSTIYIHIYHNLDRTSNNPIHGQRVNNFKLIWQFLTGRFLYRFIVHTLLTVSSDRVSKSQECNN